MAETCNPEFALASNPICFFSLLISLVSLGFYIFIAVAQLGSPDDLVQDSTYSWSTFPILIAQFSGTIIGVIAPIIRCFTVVRYKSFGRGLGAYGGCVQSGKILDSYPIRVEGRSNNLSVKESEIKKVYPETEKHRS
ncbi:unnamed protein product [Lactuca virosa]|uniref:Uncharacterized protein n=1 Tax=Lactuca virosa TaxID=75947 RepID=A0AAU9PMR9_9ASTR|nr:unnamed protein product [Lactuca virosa]